MADLSQLFSEYYPSIRDDYKRGATIPQLAEEYDVSAPTISKWLKDSGDKVRRRTWAMKGAIFETRFHEIAELYEGGADMKSIAAKYSVSGPTISNWLIKGGYKRRKRGRTPLAMKARAHELTTRGWPLEAIAELFREKPAEVERWLSEPSPQLQPVFENPGTKPKKKRRRKKVRRKRNPSIPKPPRHRCKKHWTPNEKRYVFEMIFEGATVKEIYDKTGASRARQNMILREAGVSRPPGPRKPPKIVPFEPEIEAFEAPALPEAPAGTVTQLPRRRRLPPGG